VHFNDKTLPDGQVGWTTPGTGRRNPNYGDMLVCASLLRHLAPAENLRIAFGQELSTAVDAAVLRGSTYLNREFNFSAAIRTVESIQAPIATVGLGAQSTDMDPSFLDDVPEARRFVALLDERAPSSISARGEFTAAVLERLGARNIRITGCPSMFYALEPASVSVPPTLGSDHFRLGVSLHTGLHKGRFCRNVPATMRKQRRAIQFALRSAGGVSLFEQGVMKEYLIGDRSRPMTERLEAAAQILARFPGRNRLRPSDLVDHLVSVRSVEDWMAKARELDAMIGFRFHGNMVALTQGVPCFYYLYDSRITEFARLYRLPHLDVEDEWRDPIAAMLEHDWDDTTKAIRGCFDELVAFYEENGVRHTLRTPV
jgi:Polysaccharide pyruvyl transferase